MRMRLQDRGIPCSDICPHCETNHENDWHVFIGCEAAKQVWQEAGLWERISDGVVNVIGLAACLFSCLCRFPEQVCNDITMMLWCI